MTTTPERYRRHLRHAVTLVEVLFAIGVILIGLLGLLSILPLAGKRAKDSIAFSISPQYSESVFSHLKSKKYFSKHQLQPFEVRSVTNQIFVGDPQDGFEITRPIPAFCIDPLFLAIVDYETANASLESTAKAPGYSTGTFPYYKQKLSDALEPRLFRVAPKREGNFLSPSRNFLTESAARRIAENRDELSVNQPADKSLSATVASGAWDQVTGKWSRTIPQGQFTWMATVTPLPGNVYATVAVVVFKGRQQYVQAFDENVPPTSRVPEESERIARVINFSGFSDGGGGVVTLLSSGSDKDLSQGEWIMLSRYVRHATGFRNVNHWYRVINSRRDPINGNQTVTLDGPDWNFTPHNNVNATLNSGQDTDDARYVISEPDASGDELPVNTQTHATIVENVISVTERIMKLSDL